MRKKKRIMYAFEASTVSLVLNTTASGELSLKGY